MELITVEINNIYQLVFFLQNLGKINPKNEDNRKPVNIPKLLSRIESLQLIRIHSHGRDFFLSFGHNDDIYRG